MAEICWLASYPKSGNTWLRAFLVNYLRDPETPVGINEIATVFYTDAQPGPYLRVSGKASLAELTVAEINKLRPKVQEMFVRSSPHTVFVKTHNPIVTFDGTPAIVPQFTGGAIYLVRNPLDLVVSYAHHASVTVETMIANIANDDYFSPQETDLAYYHLGSWSRHVTSWTGAPGMRLHIVRYEDLVREPHATFGGVLDFIGVTEDRDRLEKALRFCSFNELAGQERNDGFLEAMTDRGGGSIPFFRQGQVGEWRATMSDDQAQQVIDDHRDVMTRFGYLGPDGCPTI